VTASDVAGVGENSIDYVYRLPVYPQPGGPTAKTPISGQRISPGGQVATTLSTCAAMGLSTAYLGVFGNDENGRRVREALAARGVDVGAALVRDAPNRYAIILVDEHAGERVVLWQRDPRLVLQPQDVNAERIRSARLLHVDDVDLEASLAAARIARESGLPVTSDIEKTTGGVHGLLDAVTVPILAEHVPAALTGEAEMERALRAIRKPHHSMVCVTLGARGAMLLAGNTVHREPGIAVKTVDTTGAGDVFRGAFIYALLRGDAPRDILRFANAAGALSCTREGAIGGVPGVLEVEALLAAAQHRGTDAPTHREPD
jgi:sugar/nucleoside kinase (ribokinase family)